MQKRLEPSTVRAYLDALWSMARDGNTFAPEASILIREISPADVLLAEFFWHIDNEPANAFEKTLRLLAKNNIKQK